MIVFQRASQAAHTIEGFERAESFTAFPEHTLLESGNVPITEIAELALRESSRTPDAHYRRYAFQNSVTCPHLLRSITKRSKCTDINSDPFDC